MKAVARWLFSFPDGKSPVTIRAEFEEDSEIAHMPKKPIQDIILASLMLMATAIFVIYLMLVKPLIHDDIVRYLVGLRDMRDPIISEHPLSFSVFFTLLYFIHHDILGDTNPELSFRLAAIGLCLVMFLITWAIERSMLEKQYSSNLYLSRLVPLAGLFFVFNPVFITLHALAKQYILMFFMLGYILAGYVWYNAIKKCNSNFSLLTAFKSLIWLFLIYICSSLAFLSSVLCVVLFLIMASFLIEMTATIDEFRVRFLSNLGLAFVTGSAALFAREFVIQGNYSEHSPLDETTDMATASLEILQILPFPESYILLPIAGMLWLEFIRALVSVSHEKFRSSGFLRERYQLWRNRTFVVVVLLSMFWMSVNKEGAFNVIHENLSLTFLFIWVGWVAFQASLRSAGDSHHSRFLGIFQLFAIFLFILLLFMIFVFPEFNIYPTFPNDRLTIFLIIPFSFLGAYNLRKRKYDFFELFITFVLPPVVIAAVLFIGMSQQFSILNLWLYLLDPPIPIKITCFFVILASWGLTELRFVRSWVFQLKNVMLYFFLQFFSLNDVNVRITSRIILLGIIALQVIGIGIIMVLTPEVLNSEELEFTKSEIEEVIPQGARVGVPTVPLEHWIKYYHEGRYNIFMIWEAASEDSLEFRTWHFLSDPNPQTYSELVEVSPTREFYLILSNSAKGRSYLDFDLEGVLIYDRITLLSEFKGIIFVLYVSQA